MDRVWYFAYGSNMQRATFRGRRQIAWTRAVTGRVRDWRLTFDKPGLLQGASSYANIVREPGAHVLGVAYEVTRTELEHIELTEGVAIGNYDRVEVDVTPLDGGRPLSGVYSLSSPRRAPEMRPSTRYMGLVVAGAEEHALPADYVEWLRRVPANEETAAEREMRGQLDAALRQLAPQKKEPR